MGARKPGGCTFTLPRHLTARLLVYCGERREQPADVIADLVVLLLDDCGPRYDASEFLLPAVAGTPPDRAYAEPSPGRSDRADQSDVGTGSPTGAP